MDADGGKAGQSDGWMLMDGWKRVNEGVNGQTSELMDVEICGLKDGQKNGVSTLRVHTLQWGEDKQGRGGRRRETFWMKE